MTNFLHALQSFEDAETRYADLDGGLRMQRFGYREDIWFPPHRHEELSIVICTAGAIECTQFGLSETLEPGDVVVTNRQILHASRYVCRDGSASGVAFELDLETQRRLGLEATLFLGRMRFEWLGAMMGDLLREIAEQRAHWERMRNALAQQIVLRLLRDWPAELRRRGQAHSCELLTRQEFVEATAAMHRGRALPGHAQTDFDRRFRNTTGVAPAEFRRSLRRLTATPETAGSRGIG